MINSANIYIPAIIGMLIVVVFCVAMFFPVKKKERINQPVMIMLEDGVEFQLLIDAINKAMTATHSPKEHRDLTNLYYKIITQKGENNGR